MAPIDIVWCNTARTSKDWWSWSREVTTRGGSLDKDSLESLLRELGIEGNDVMRKKLARYRYRQKQQFDCRERTNSGSRTSTSTPSHDCHDDDDDDTGSLYDARRHTPSDLLNEEDRLLIQANEEERRRERKKDRHRHRYQLLHDDNQDRDDTTSACEEETTARYVYRDCHYSKGSAYGYLINRCPEHPFTIVTPPKCRVHSHGHSHGYGYTIADTAAALRHIEWFFTPGMILFAMLVLLLVSVAVVEAVDMIWKKKNEKDEEAALFPSSSQGGQFVLVPQEEDGQDKISEGKKDNDHNDDIDEKVL
ncbi:hypothetical protein VTN77DRAFT_8913 [Rasamsonia byssochlamydoides]|uniref:uncharacterized protein n=1 Tax=Rasamsonia byssochlamydoides TaxID=89139 RepID=UPI003743C5D6